MSTSPPTIYDSFNARTLSADQVAQTFVPSKHFEALCRRAHTLVLGPRGSGKTTLLKMLQPAALERWANPAADTIVAGLDFTGVFVATDVSWGEQLRALGQSGLDEEARSLLSIAAFTTHALRALIIAFEQRASERAAGALRDVRRIRLDGSREAQAVRLIAPAFHLTGIVPSFFGLRSALSARLAAVHEIASREALLGAKGRRERLAARPELHLSFLPSAACAIEAFEDAATVCAGKWAYLFDELELAPNQIRKELFSFLRSTDERFLFKLALNPFGGAPEIQVSTSAARGQDYEQIKLWYPERRDAEQFCEDLWKGIAKERGLGELAAIRAFGESYFSGAEEMKRGESPYGRGSRWARRFRNLGRRDPSFGAYLIKNGLDPRSLDAVRGPRRAAEIRKIAPIVAVREYYMRQPEEGTRRSRKSSELFTGRDSLFAVTEGNPRWFIGMVNGMILRAAGPKFPVPRHIQSDEIRKAAQRFAATLRTVPYEASDMGAQELVRKIGLFFHRDAASGSFKPEPSGSFTVDSNASEGTLRTLGRAMNAGAILFVPDADGEQLLGSLRGKRFRLAYLLAPLYGFPIRLGKTISLGKIISSSRDEGHIPAQMTFAARSGNANE